MRPARASTTFAFLVLSAVASACSGTGLEDASPAPGIGSESLPPDATSEQVDAFRSLESSTRERWRWTQDAVRKSVMHLEAARTDKAAVVKGSDAAYATLSVLAAHKALFMMKSPSDELVLEKTELDAVGMTHARFQQVVRGVPVAGAELMAHYDAAGHLTSIDSNYISDLDLDVTPALAAADALAKAKEHVLSLSVVEESTLEPDAGRLVVFAPEPSEQLAVGGAAKLAYEYKIRALEADDPAIWVIKVDATTGEVLQKYNNLQTVQGSGVGVLGDTKTFEVTPTNGGFVMIDSSAGVEIRTLTARQQQVAPGSQITSASATSWDTGVAGAGAAVDAHFNAIAVFKYYKEKHGRNAIDGAGGPMLSTAHYGRNYENAAWDSVGMFYGDGGQALRPLSVSLDVVGHEFTHGVIEKTSNLIYLNQSGALNEAVADIMGAFVEHSVAPDPIKNWQLGENVMRNGGSALRDMKNPTAVDDPQPAHMSRFVNTQQDNGGVHINSGIINNAAFLMTMGGKNPVSNIEVKFGIGWEKSEKLWYRANAQYFMQSTNFGQAAQGLLQAAKDINLTQNEQNIVDCALKATGLLQGTCATLLDPATTTPDPTGGDDPGQAPGSSVGEDEEEDEEEEETTKPKKSPKKRRLVTREVSGCSATHGDAGSSGLALLGVALVLGAARRRRR